MYHPAKLVAIFLFVQKMASAQVDLGSMESWVSVAILIISSDTPVSHVE